MFLLVLASALALDSYAIRIAVSSSLTRTAERIAAEAHQTLGFQFEVISGGSSKLRVQIAEGAPFDFFLSADPEGFPDKEALRVPDGQLVLWSMKERPDLKEAIQRGQFERLALSEPALTPYGRAARAVLERLGQSVTKNPRIVRAQNVNQVAEWIHSGSVDFGFVAASMFEKGLPEKGSAWLIPSDWHPPIIQQWFKLRSNEEDEVFWKWLHTHPLGLDPIQGESVDWGAIGLTLKLAFLSSCILLVLGVPGVWILYLRRNRWWAKMTRALIALPLALPPTVLGFYLLMFFSKTGLSWAFTFKGLVLGSILYSLPFVTQPIYSALEQFGTAIFEQAASLGLRPVRVFLKVGLPMLRPSIIAGGLLGFAHTLGEFGVVLMIGGGLSGHTRVASIALYEYVEAMRYPEAHRLAAFMLLTSFVLILVVQFFQRRQDLKIAASLRPSVPTIGTHSSSII